MAQAGLGCEHGGRQHGPSEAVVGGVRLGRLLTPSLLSASLVRSALTPCRAALAGHPFFLALLCGPWVGTANGPAGHTGP